MKHIEVTFINFYSSFISLTTNSQLLNLVRGQKAFVHVSTAFSNIDREEVDEVIYPSKMDPIKLSEFIDEADETLIKNITKE